MPIDLLTLGAVFISGLLGSAHCVAMCGGIATGLAVSATPKEPSRSMFGPALQLNVGRVLGYVLAGGIVGAFGGGLLAVVRVDAVASVLRALVGAAMILVALRLLGKGDRFAWLAAPGRWLWRRLAPLQRALMPARTWPRRMTLGVLWGWLPCGLSSSLLVVAWLQASALHGALVMAAFGAGTLPMMLPLTWSGARVGRHLRQGRWRVALAGLVLVAGTVTLSAPLLMQVPALHGALSLLGCLPPRS